MSYEQRQRVETYDGDVVDYQEREVEYTPSMLNVLIDRVSQLLWLLVGILSMGLAFRIILKLMAANPQNDFVDLIYDLTAPFVAPFAGIVGTPDFTGNSVFDVAAFFALILYPVAVYMMMLFLNLFRDRGGVRHVSTRVHHHR